MPCAGEADVKGQVVRCSHPRLRHPVRPAEALAVSCNVWFATIGARLPRARLDGVLTALGLPPTPAGAPMPLAATGLRASPSPPLAWVEALSRLLRQPSAVPLSPGGERDAGRRTARRRALRHGRRLQRTRPGCPGQDRHRHSPQPAARWASSSPAGPPSAPTRAIVLVAAGVAGKDAADLAAAVVAAAPGASAEPPPSEASAPCERSEQPPPAEPPAARSAERPRRFASASHARAAATPCEALALEDYVARVLAGEAAAGSPPAALEALAIAVRTFAFGNRGRHQRDGFDLCTLTHCQVLRELMPRCARPRRPRRAGSAGERRAGHRLPHGLLRRPHGASVGGLARRRRPAVPALEADRACGGEPRWAAEIPVQDLERTLLAAGYRGHAAARPRCRRPQRIGTRRARALKGMTPDAISGQDLRMVVGRTLGWHLLKSTDFTVRRTGGGYRFDGKGFGHGVGLCVLGFGAPRRTRRLGPATSCATYFPGARNQPASDPHNAPAAPKAPAAPEEPAEPAVPEDPTSLTLSAHPPSPSAARRRASRRRALADLRRHGPAGAGRPRLCFTRRRELPPGDGRVVVDGGAHARRSDRFAAAGGVARARHARVHAAARAGARADRHALEGRAEWVKEGVAMHFAGEPPPASLLDADGVPRRVRCPSDDDLRRPVSAATARQAYGLAAACVARALADGRAGRHPLATEAPRDQPQRHRENRGDQPQRHRENQRDQPQRHREKQRDQPQRTQRKSMV